MRHDVLVMAVVGIAHGTSHFFQLVLPPLFPFLIAEFTVNYTELGLLMTTFFLASGFGQPLAGFLVDRFGARRVLLLGLGIYLIAFLLLSFASSFWIMFPIIALAGIGNCVFHPADFTILNANVRTGYLGRAFGVHTLGGNLGWALAPVSMLILADIVGWRGALLGAVAFGAIVWALVWWFRAELHEEARAEPGANAAAPSNASVLLQPAIVLCFIYFAFLAAALIAVQNFLPTILGALYATPKVLAGLVLTAFLIGAALGVLFGGFLADRSQQHTAIVAGGMAGSAVLFLSVAHIDYSAALLLITVGSA
ncbi:MAG: FSR family fosmidomycin resistance protein-like MFS transporter, partial [Gammaproteobacteria bacterium]